MLNRLAHDIARWRREQQGPTRPPDPPCHRECYADPTLHPERDSRCGCPCHGPVMKRDDRLLASLMMVVTEISEAAEDVRHSRWDHLPEELADAMIRLLGICGRLNIDIERAIIEKMEKNTA